jgi:hypothetical protein
MNPIGLLKQQEELRGLSQQVHFLNGKGRGDAKRKKLYFQLLRRVRRLRKRLFRDLESVCRNLEGRGDLPPSRRLRGQEALCLIAEDLTDIASGQRGRQHAPCCDGQGADHQYRSRSFNGQRR